MPRRTALKALAAAAMAGAAPGAKAKAKDDEEAALEPHLPIVDPHHHFRDSRDPKYPRARYLCSDLVSDIDRSGHKITDTLFVECSIMYRPEGPLELRSLGEVEYVRSVAERNQADHPMGCKIAAGIISKVDLRVGARAADLLHQHMEASGGRLRGVRNSIAWDAYAPLAAMGLNKDLLSDPDFRQGFAALAPLGLSFDVWLFHPQIPALTQLARAFPQTTIVLNHLGNPLGVGPYAGREQEVRVEWADAMKDLAGCPNVLVKLGGMGPFWTPRSDDQAARTSVVLAEQWRPYVETSIDLFGVKRCMFESNYPANSGVSSYGAIWNAFKRISAKCSDAEKASLYSLTAKKSYRIT